MYETPEPYLPMTPADEVDALLRDARRVQRLHPTLQTMFDKHRELLLDVLSRQVDLLKTRSQAVEDAHVTVYDKVLLALTDHGHDLENSAAITWYCSEYFGFNPDVVKEHNMRAIEQSLAFPVALAQAATIGNSANIAVSPLSNHVSSPVFTSPVDHEHDIWSSKDLANWHRFCDVYDSALKDFDQVAGRTDTDTLEAARWLRDTAENGIHFLERFPRTEGLIIRELKHTYTRAQGIVEQMAGGKKRKFDHYAEIKQEKVDVDGGRSLEKARKPERRYEPAQIDHGRRERRELFPQHARTAYAQRHDRDHTGRGHSKVPYGYAETRIVDSYVPSRDGVKHYRYSGRR